MNLQKLSPVDLLIEMYSALIAFFSLMAKFSALKMWGAIGRPGTDKTSADVMVENNVSSIDIVAFFNALSWARYLSGLGA